MYKHEIDDATRDSVFNHLMCSEKAFFLISLTLQKGAVLS